MKTLTGTRKLELGGVVNDLEGMAARDQFRRLAHPRAVPDAPAQHRVVDHSSPLLSYGYRTSFPGSELVFQYYPGHGLQIQWLGTFGKLNGYWTGGKRYDARAGALLDEAMPLATERAGGLAWEYLFPFDGQSPPWVSSLAQGTGLQAMARAATRLGRQADVFPVAAARAWIFQTPPPAGVRVADGGGAHYLQYSGLAEAADPQRLRPVARRALRLRRADRRRDRALALRRGRRSRRARRCRRSTPAPGRCTRAGRPAASPTSATTRCCATSSSSSARARAVPSTAAPASTSRPTSRSRRSSRCSRARCGRSRTGKLRFKLSKISRVSRARHARDPGRRRRSTPGTLGRGTKTLAWFGAEALRHYTSRSPPPTWPGTGHGRG